jgi:hypothetical protein
VIDHQQLRWHLLDMAHRDYHGLHEAVSQVGLVVGSNDEEGNLRLAKELLTSLLKEGLIELLSEDDNLLPGGHRFERDLQPIPAEHFTTTISSRRSWEPFGFGEKGVAFAATSKGDEAWYHPERFTQSPHKA